MQHPTKISTKICRLPRQNPPPKPLTSKPHVTQGIFRCCCHRETLISQAEWCSRNQPPSISVLPEHRGLSRAHMTSSVRVRLMVAPTTGRQSLQGPHVSSQYRNGDTGLGVSAQSPLAGISPVTPPSWSANTPDRVPSTAESCLCPSTTREAQAASSAHGSSRRCQV